MNAMELEQEVERPTRSKQLMANHKQGHQLLMRQRRWGSIRIPKLVCS